MQNYCVCLSVFMSTRCLFINKNLKQQLLNRTNLVCICQTVRVNKYILYFEDGCRE